MGDTVGHEKEEAGGMFGGEIDVTWSEPEKRPVWFRQGGWMEVLMYTSPKMACLDNIYYKLRNDAGWLIALGMYLKIQDTSHKTAFLSEGDTAFLYGDSQSVPSFLLHFCTLCIWSDSQPQDKKQELKCWKSVWKRTLKRVLKKIREPVLF